MAKLSQKEKMLLNDQKKHEEVCIQKYENYASQSQDAQLSQLFSSFAQQERTHLDTINQILSGTVPNMNQGQSGQSQSSMQSSTQSSSGVQSSSSSSMQGQSSSSFQSQQASGSMQNQSSSVSSSMNDQATSSAAPQGQSQSSYSSSYTNKDEAMCNDMLMTEKYVSGAYDTAIFEFTDASVRQALNHIQKEEQQHGEQIFNYMQSHGMYNVHS